MKKALIQHTAVFLLTVLAAVLLLTLGACLPQSPIDENVRKSADAMVKEGCYPTIADHAYASTLDYTTDALILMESKSTSISRWDSILTNPEYRYGTGDNTPVENLYQYVHDEDPQPGRYYVQYWMGFRPVIRLLLCFLDYYQILRYTAVVFFVLFAAVICSLADHTGTKTAFLFALSIITVRPHVISVSLQFSCCFFLAFLAMLAVPRIHREKKWESLFFLELGILTQYFDFYTTPILTFVLPMTYLYLLQVRDQKPSALKSIGLGALSWSAGYGLMWLAKLVLTSLFTHVEALGQGFASFQGRIGIEKVQGMEKFYSPMAALRSVAVSLYSDREGKLILAGILVLAFILLLGQFLKKKQSVRALLQYPHLLLLAALPVLWFIAAAQPTANHHWFQYRGIAGSFWAGFVWLQYLLRKKTDFHE